MKFLWNDEALTEYEQAAEYYGLKEIGLDGRFADCIESTIQSVCSSPKMWPIIEDDVRRGVTHTFPYSVVYIQLDQMIVIIAIMHDRREPGYWRNRLE
ncbi:MAG: type II toxin-antitoxin system RelE/ParE family toxin [Pyrinomonadaceae bacterium]|nr:type II toxin-antitoxin system RelE/ParE family toxin [Chloracidobacterium sp.]